MLISISDPVSHEVFGIEAVAVAADCLSGDLNMDDFNSPFLLIWPCKKLNLSCIQICLSVLFTAACPDFVWVSLPYVVSNHFLTALTDKFLEPASPSQRPFFFLCLSSSVSLVVQFCILLHKLDNSLFIRLAQENGLHLPLLLPGLS